MQAPARHIYLDEAREYLSLSPTGREGDIRLLCTSMDAALQRMGSADRFREETIRLAPGDRIDLNDLIRRLTAMGYERVSMVEGKGQCALRGGIIDVYPPACSQSLRIEFFDDEVDSIREFDCISQRSLDSVEKCTLTPATEVLLPPVDAEKAARRMRDAIERQGGGIILMIIGAKILIEHLFFS